MRSIEERILLLLETNSLDSILESLGISSFDVLLDLYNKGMIDERTIPL